jgi:hypothetical protein
MTNAMTGPQWSRQILLGIVLAAVIITFVAVVLPIAALVAALALLVTGTAFLVQRFSPITPAARAASRSTNESDATHQPTLMLDLADGTVLAARTVENSAEHALLLTRKGYVVVDAEGRIRHWL